MAPGIYTIWAKVGPHPDDVQDDEPIQIGVEQDAELRVVRVVRAGAVPWCGDRWILGREPPGPEARAPRASIRCKFGLPSPFT